MASSAKPKIPNGRAFPPPYSSIAGVTNVYTFLYEVVVGGELANPEAPSSQQSVNIFTPSLLLDDYV